MENELAPYKRQPLRPVWNMGLGGMELRLVPCKFHPAFKNHEKDWINPGISYHPVSTADTAGFLVDIEIRYICGPHIDACVLSTLSIHMRPLHVTFELHMRTASEMLTVGVATDLAAWLCTGHAR